jgi:hypothetical protein
MIEIEIALENQVFQFSAGGWGVTEYIKNFSHVFTSGKTYGIVGEFGDGAWSIACLLSGLVSLPVHKNLGKSSITLNGMSASRKELYKNSCFLKSGVAEEKRFALRERTVREQIIRGISHTQGSYSIQDIVELFQLSSERLDQPLSIYSGEGWRASIAIGFAYGKKIFACPWLQPSSLHYVGSVEFQPFFDLVKQSGAIVIMPTNKIIWAEHCADELFFLENPYIHMLPPEIIS